MRLYLSSFLIGNHPEKFIELIGGEKRVALILNALDNFPVVRDEYLASQTEALERLGLAVEELDLRRYFGRFEKLNDLLKEKDAVWVNGGNTFILRRAMKQSGFDAIITELLEKDALAYGGFSAGSVILSPSLRGLEITDNPNTVPDGYDQEIIWEGLNIIDFSMAVHYQSEHSESKLTDLEIEYYKANHIPYRTLRDGEALIINQELITESSLQ